MPAQLGTIQSAVITVHQHTANHTYTCLSLPLHVVMAQEQAAGGGLDLVVAGHASFPDPAAPGGFQSVWGQHDAHFYDTIVLLSPPPGDIASRSHSRQVHGAAAGTGSAAKSTELSSESTAAGSSVCETAAAPAAAAGTVTTTAARVTASSASWSRRQPLTAQDAAAWMAWETATLRAACSNSQRLRRLMAVPALRRRLRSRCSWMLPGCSGCAACRLAAGRALCC